MPAFQASDAPFADPLWYSRPASPYYQESHRTLRQHVREYVDQSITPFCEEWEEQGYIPQDVLARHAKLGYQTAAVFPLPKDLLGDNLVLPAGIPAREWDAFHDLIVIDELARCGYLGIVWALSCGNSIGCPPVAIHGTTAVKRKYLPDVYAGKTRFCLAVTEPDAGSDVAGITTTAERKGNVYIVNGAKKWITNGISADYATAAVRTGGKGSRGVSALVIPLGSKGVSRRKIDNSGVKASGSTFIEFDNVEVPAENLLGKENEGFSIIMSSAPKLIIAKHFNHERLWLACTSLRLARVCVEDAYQHALVRKTYGKPLIENQVIRSKFATFAQSIEPVHAYMEQIVHLMSTTAPNTSEERTLYLGGLCANLKVSAARTLERVNREAQQVMGGLGYSKKGRGGRIEQISRDVRVMVVGGGSEEILMELTVNQEVAARRQKSKI